MEMIISAIYALAILFGLVNLLVGQTLLSGTEYAAKQQLSFFTTCDGKFRTVIFVSGIILSVLLNHIGWGTFAALLLIDVVLQQFYYTLICNRFNKEYVKYTGLSGQK